MSKRRSKEYRRCISLLLDMRRRDHKELYEALNQGYNVTEYARQLLMKQLGIQRGSGVSPVELEPAPETHETPSKSALSALLPPTKTAVGEEVADAAPPEPEAKPETEAKTPGRQKDLLDLSNLGF